MSGKLIAPCVLALMFASLDAAGQTVIQQGTESRGGAAFAPPSAAPSAARSPASPSLPMPPAGNYGGGSNGAAIGGALIGLGGLLMSLPSDGEASRQAEAKRQLDEYNRGLKDHLGTARAVNADAKARFLSSANTPPGGDGFVPVSGSSEAEAPLFAGDNPWGNDPKAAASQRSAAPRCDCSVRKGTCQAVVTAKETGRTRNKPMSIRYLVDVTVTDTPLCARVDYEIRKVSSKLTEGDPHLVVVTGGRAQVEGEVLATMLTDMVVGAGDTSCYVCADATAASASNQ